jgi:putative IMPACT (imprinted ancient) family translation regulator
MVCEVYEYSGERLSTGIEAIDNIEREFSINMSAFRILTQDGYAITDQDGYHIVEGAYNLDSQTHDYNSDNEEIQAEADDIFDWSEVDPFSEGTA